MNFLATLSGIYSVLLIVGGIIGYMFAGSTISLWSGILSGLAFIVLTLGIFNGASWGVYGGAVLALLLGVVFVLRFWKTGAWMPAGGMMVISFLVAALLYFTYVFFDL